LILFIFLLKGNTESKRQLFCRIIGKCRELELVSNFCKMTSTQKLRIQHRSSNHQTLQTQQIGIDNDAVGWLSANISGDRQKVRGELEKLITYKGEDKSPVTLDDARACCGEAGALALDDLVYSVAGHNANAALKTFNQLTEESVPFIVILRSLQNHFRRLHVAKAKIENGESADQAIKSLAPPIFFKQQAAFKTQTQRWSLNGISNVLQKLMDLEAQCKQTGMPVETLCAQAVLGISKSRG